jgi:hypothetical protein
MANESFKVNDNTAVNGKAGNHDPSAKAHEPSATAGAKGSTAMGAKPGHTAAECTTKGCTATHLPEKHAQASGGAAPKTEAKGQPSAPKAEPPRKST